MKYREWGAIHSHRAMGFKRAAASAASALCAMALVAGLSGCAGNAVASTIGSNTAGAASFNITNYMGKGITSIAYKASDDASYGGDLEQDGYLPYGKSAVIYFGDIDEGQNYDLDIDCEDGTRYELYDVELGDMKDATLKTQGQVAYVLYTSLADGSTVNTLDEEEALSGAEGKKAQKKARKEARAHEKEAEKAAKDKTEKKANKEKKASGASTTASSSDSSASAKFTGSSSQAKKSSSASSRAASSSASRKASAGSKPKSGSGSGKSSSSAHPSKGSASKGSSAGGSSKASKPSQSSKPKPSSSGSSSSGEKEDACVDDILLK